MKKLGLILGLLLLGCGALYWYWQGKSERAEELFAFASINNELSSHRVDHSGWQAVLDEYLDSDEEDVNLFAYADLKDEGTGELQRYLNELAAIDPRDLNADEQLAFWINLYNAATVKVIVDSYPVETIRELGDGVLPGPWNEQVVEIAGLSLSLNDIEHRILRPVFEDERIHFGVNCASISCPDLMPQAFTGDNVDNLLDIAATAYLSHPRGLRFDGDTLVLSSIFSWYGSDFGASEVEVLEVLAGYLDGELADALENHTGPVRYEYDWSLNELI